MSDPQFDSWRRALAGEKIAIKETEPLSGFWKVWTGKTSSGAAIYKPLGIWRDGVDLVVQFDGADLDPVAEKARVAKLWLSGSSKPCTAESYDFALTSGRWPEDVAGPKAPAPAEKQIDLVEVIEEATSVAASGPPPAGHNSGAAPDVLAQMRADLATYAETCAEHYSAHGIGSKTEADAAENARKRLVDDAKAADAKRRDLKKPHEDAAAAVDAAWFPAIRRAQEVARAIDAKAQAWVKAENARLAAEAAEAARKEREQQEREAAALEAKRQELLKTAPVEALKITPPPAPLPPPEPVAAPKVMIGTAGARRGERKGPATAEIVDPLALAGYLIGINHPEVLEWLQKIANASARAKVPLPGCRMPWEAEQKGAA